MEKITTRIAKAASVPLRSCISLAKMDTPGTAFYGHSGRNTRGCIDWPEPRELPPKYKEPRSSTRKPNSPRPSRPMPADYSIRMQVPAEMVAVPLIAFHSAVSSANVQRCAETNDSSWVEYGSLWGVSLRPRIPEIARR